MTKLLNKYRVSRSYDDARRLANYDAKHPFAACILSPEDAALLAEANKLVRVSRAA
ncbi:hypothetical protein GJ654_10310 [Rhodoblastus acidophilus]|uniref:Uncharacterized protein n=1 Tax=Rhodoblastus acidophilus TaxID=1074 RepID=A0A6N8DNF7_RHOAC|nr:hypothetical protein [Rhodoblastus acidophilus]MCW2275117.1 hypothetical protein [Rhodoblastus acidophilus]MTV31386.1 hypothetical protein [Rhodoblastus acidophilus]